MRALSIRQPWAWAIVQADKRIENRRWATPYRGTILIHAAARWGRHEQSARAYLMMTRGLDIPDPPDLGGIVGIATLARVVCKSRDSWFEGPFGWALEDVRPLPFVPLRGNLGLFRVPEAVLGKLGLMPA